MIFYAITCRSERHLIMAKLPPLNTLRCFEAAARHKSFSRAATELHITQSAVSHQVRQLEDWFGTALFLRQGRVTAPTERGEELARSLAEAFDLMQEACKRVQLADHATALTVAVLPSIATIWLIPRLESFYAAHPSVPVKVVYLIHGQKIDFHDIDIAITWGPQPHAAVAKGSKFTQLLAGDTVAVANPVLLEKFGEHLSRDDLRHVTLLHDTDRQGWQHYMKKAGLSPVAAQPGPVFEDFNMLRAAALAGQGLALCPRLMIEDDVQAKRLVVLFDSISINEDHGYWLLEADDTSRQTSAVTAFRDWVLQQARP